MLSVFKNINKFAGRWKWLDLFAIFCARVLPYLLVIILFLYAFLISNIYLFLYAILSGIFARLIVNELVHVFYKEKRPAHLEETKILIPVPKNLSFPSGHSSFFFGVSFLILFFNFWLGIIFLFFSLIIGTARVFCGVHWFRDVVGGLAAGLASAIIIHYLITIIRI